MEPRPQEVTVAAERLRAALDQMAAALASGELSQLLTAQESLLAARIPSDTLRGWTEESRVELRTALRKARASLNGCQRVNHVLLKLVDDFLTGTTVDYTRQGSLVSEELNPRSESRVSCRV